MQHISAEDIDFYARRDASEPKNPEVETHLADCPSCRLKLAAAVEFSLALPQLRREAVEMRDSKRIPTDQPAMLALLDSPSTDGWEVRIRDISAGGMCVITPKPIYRGTQVKVQRGPITSFGEVRYCITVGEFFKTGIRLQEVSDVAQSDLT